MSDTTTTNPPEGEAVGRFRMSIVLGEPTQESDALWNGRADALARWLAAEWQQKRSEQQAQGGDQHAF